MSSIKVKRTIKSSSRGAGLGEFGGVDVDISFIKQKKEIKKKTSTIFFDAWLSILSFGLPSLASNYFGDTYVCLVRIYA